MQALVAVSVLQAVLGAGFAAWDTGEGARYHSYADIVAEMQRLERVHPEYVQLLDAQRAFGLGFVGIRRILRVHEQSV